jgi:hypothetical protein
VKPVWDLDGIAADNIIKMVRKPSEEPYWKNRGKDACMDIFCITTLDRTRDLIGIMEAQISKHGFAKDFLGIYIQPIQHGRNCHLEFNLMYDSKSAQEENIVKCIFESASAALINHGAFFSRPYGIWSDLVYKRDPKTVKALHLVKEILDPKWIFNPGKLCFKKEGV